MILIDNIYYTILIIIFIEFLKLFFITFLQYFSHLDVSSVVKVGQLGAAVTGWKNRKLDDIFRYVFRDIFSR